MICLRCIGSADIENTRGQRSQGAHACKYFVFEVCVLAPLAIKLYLCQTNCECSKVFLVVV